MRKTVIFCFLRKRRPNRVSAELQRLLCGGGVRIGKDGKCALRISPAKRFPIASSSSTKALLATESSKQPTFSFASHGYMDPAWQDLSPRNLSSSSLIQGTEGDQDVYHQLPGNFPQNSHREYYLLAARLPSHPNLFFCSPV